MSQIYGQLKDTDGTTRWKPIAAIPQPDGTFHLACDTELVLDGANISISNIKVGSTNQSSSTLKYLKTEDDGTLITVAIPLDSFTAIDILDPHHESNPGVNYYGYADTEEDWYILEETVTVAGSEDKLRYVKGSGNYATAWANKTGHTYDYYFNTF